MKKSSLYVLVALVACFTACQVRESQPAKVIRFTATLDQALTKTVLAPGETSGASVLWAEGDAISIFANSGSEASVLTLKEGAGTKRGVFEGSVDASEYLAFYPSSLNPSMVERCLQFSWPAIQQHSATRLAEGYMPMVAYSTSTQLSFMNLSSLVRLSLVGEAPVTRIVFRSAQPSVKVCGTASFSFDGGQVSFADADPDSLVLTMDPVQLLPDAPTDFYLVLPPQTYPGGFTVRVYSQDKYMEKAYTSDFTLERSRLHKADVFALVLPEDPDEPVDPQDPDEPQEPDWMEDPVGWQSMPFHHQSLIMRFTGTWCGWCPYMNKAVSIAQEQYPGKLQHLALHSGGDLDFLDTSSLIYQYGITGFPTGIVDGRICVENTRYPEVTATGLVDAFLQTEKEYPTVSAAAICSELMGNALVIDVRSYFKEAGAYKITVLLLEDGIINPQAGGEDPYVHNSVARLSVTDIRGELFDIEADNTTRDFHYETTVPSGCVVGNMRVLVYYQRKFGALPVIQTDGSYGDFFVDNCATASLGTVKPVELDQSGGGGNEGITPGDDIDVN